MHFAEGFYDIEYDGSSYFRWMQDQGQIIINSEDRMKVSLSFELFSNPKIQGLKADIYFNAEPIYVNFNADGRSYTKFLEINPGVNVIKLLSNQKAIMPSESDTRKLSLALRNYILSQSQNKE